MNRRTPAHRPPEPGAARPWLAGHRQRLSYTLVAFAMAIVVGAAAAGGMFLHKAVLIERQTLRTQQLGGLAFQLQNFSSRAQTANGVSAGLAAERARARRAANAAFESVRLHDPAAGRRIRPSYVAYVGGSTRAFARAAANHGRIPPAQQRHVERRLGHLEARVDAEIARLAHATHVTNPRARFFLILAAVAAALLIGLLIWQFEMQRRAGQIDRDNAERSEELMRLRDDFAAAVSHELRTPLTSVLGYLELIRDSDSAGERSPEDEAYLAVIQRNAERLLRLVSDLLLVAEVEGGMLALQMDDVDLEALATECVEAAMPAADAKEIELSLTQGSPGHLRGDPIRLAQMMDNLVSNAIKFTPAGGRVTITTASRDGLATFEVADTGIGVAAADQPHLFDRFFRTRDAAARATTGTGLGLTITKAIVDAHGGTISVASTVGAGTTFSVRLPQAADEPAAPTRPTTAHA